MITALILKRVTGLMRGAVGVFTLDPFCSVCPSKELEVP